MNSNERPYSIRLSDYSVIPPKRLSGLEKKRFWYQFVSINNIFKDRRYERIRRKTEWCMRFFRENPSIEQVPQGFPVTYRGLTGLVDVSLEAVNNTIRWTEVSLRLDKKVDRIRKKYYKIAKQYENENFRIPGFGAGYPERKYTEKITYRIPSPLAFAQVGLDKHIGVIYPIGRCEEHTFLTIYFLTIGHMIQDMPFGQLKGDIFYTTVCEPNHAFVILVKGSEFKLAIQEARKATKTGEDNIVSWLIRHTKTWGENAWIVDGWNGRSKLLKDYAEELDYFMTEGEYTRNRLKIAVPEYLQLIAEDAGIHPDMINQLSPKQLEPLFEHEGFSTEWDVTVRRMIKRIESNSL